MQLLGNVVRKAVMAWLADDWSELMRNENLNPRMVESYTRHRKSIAKEVMLRSMYFLRRIIALVRVQGGVTLSYVCFHCHRFPLAHYIWRVSLTPGTASKIRKKQCNWEVFTAVSPTGGTRTDSFFFQDGADPAMRRVFWLTSSLSLSLTEVCVCARTSCLLLNYWSICKRAGTIWWTRLVRVCWSKGKLTITDDSRRFIEVDNEETVKQRELEKNSEVLQVVRSMFNKDIFLMRPAEKFGGELTLRSTEAGMLRTYIDATNVQTTDGGQRERSTNWHAVCHAICRDSRASGVAALVRQVCGNEPRGQRP